MIDIHCHILPGVDDGPKTIEKSLRMLKMAENDGITGIIATPHHNHPMGYEGNGAHEAFQLLKEGASVQGIGVDLYYGAEQYLSKEDVTRFGSDFTMNVISSGGFVLVEFKRHMDLESMLGVIHELKIRGFIPILAHVEAYPSIVANKGALSRLRNEGALIQVNATVFKLSKEGKTVRKILRAIAEGQVDYVASDAHGLNQRPPLLKYAYKIISNAVSEEVANQIFVVNPERLIQGTMPLKRQPYPLKRKMPVKSFASIFVIVTALLLTAAMGLANGNNQEIEISNEAPLEIEEEIPLASVVTEPALPEDVNEPTNEPIEIIEVVPVETPSFEDIASKYELVLLDYKLFYENSLDRLVSEIQEVRATIDDQDEKNRLVDALIDEIFDLEAQSDNQVYDLLYTLQNELEQNDYPVAIVSEYRETYLQLKQEKENYYCEKMK